MGDNEEKSAPQKAMDAVKGAADSARETVHNATKSEEDKTMAEKASDKAPDSASDAGSTIGQKIDEGVSAAKDKIDEAQKEDRKSVV